MGGMTVHSTNGVDIDASSTDAGKIGLFCTLIDVQGDGTTAPELRLWDGNDNNHLGILAPQALTANTTWTLPNGNGSAGQVLTTNGAIPNATLSWTTLNGANTALSNLAATSINQNLLPDSSSNYRHLGAMSNMWAGLHVNVLYDSSDNNCISFDGTGAVRMMHYAAGTATFDASGNISSATAVSGTFANPTSITVVHGLITAIS